MSDDDLYHYTTGRGLVGMLQPPGKHAVFKTSHLELHATDALYLNDARELVEVGVQLHKLARRYRSRYGDGERGLQLDSWFPESGPNPAGLLSSGASSPKYVFSLSMKENMLSQWRAYTTPGDAYTLRLSRSALIEELPNVQGGWTFAACEYVDAEQDDSPSATLDDLLVKLIGRPEEPWQRPEGAAEAKALLDSISYAAVRVKHAAFAEEAEWRLATVSMRTGPEEVDFKPGYFSLKPFCKLRLPARVLTGIGVGPGPHQNLAARAVRQLLAQRGFGHVQQVECSQTPFRSS